MNKVETLAKISFKPVKNPCKNIYINDNDPDFVYFEYERTTISEPIKTNEIEHFCDDTLKLLKLFTVEFNHFGDLNSPTNPRYHSPESKQKVFDTVSAYMVEWGELIPKKDNRISDREIADISNWYSCAKTFWHLNENSSENKWIDSTLKLFEHNFLPLQEGEEFWQIIVGPDFEGGHKNIGMFSDKRKMSSAYSDFWVIIKSPTAEELKKINFSKQNKINWIRGIMLSSVTNYLSKNPVKFITSLRESGMHFSGETENLFLSFVMNDLLQADKREIAFCECGCGRLVPSNRKSYFSNKCRENMPARKIAHWLKVRKDRGQLSNEKYYELMDTVIEELNDGKSEKEIRERIALELKMS